MKKAAVLSLSIGLLFCSSVCAAEERSVEQSFQEFCRYWMGLHKKFNPPSVVCKNLKETYVAEYSALSEQFDTAIKKTTNTRSPYVGILKYRECKYQCTGTTFEGAVNGPFKVVSESLVTELFLYMNGKWQF